MLSPIALDRINSRKTMLLLVRYCTCFLDALRENQQQLLPIGVWLPSTRARPEDLGLERAPGGRLDGRTRGGDPGKEVGAKQH